MAVPAFVVEHDVLYEHVWFVQEGFDGAGAWQLLYAELVKSDWFINGAEPPFSVNDGVALPFGTALIYIASIRLHKPLEPVQAPFATGLSHPWLCTCTL